MIDLLVLSWKFGDDGLVLLIRYLENSILLFKDKQLLLKLLYFRY